jgi:hypothetical protein
MRDFDLDFEAVIPSPGSCGHANERRQYEAIQYCTFRISPHQWKEPRVQKSAASSPPLGLKGDAALSARARLASEMGESKGVDRGEKGPSCGDYRYKIWVISRVEGFRLLSKKRGYRIYKNRLEIQFKAGLAPILRINHSSGRQALRITIIISRTHAYSPIAIFTLTYHSFFLLF